MHKIDIDNNKENKLKLSELKTLLLIDMGFFSNLKKQKIKFNPKPFSNHENIKNKTLSKKPKEKNVDLHLNLIKRIDELIEENKDLTKIVHDPFLINEKHIHSPLSEIVEIREPSLKKLEMPLSKNQLIPSNFNADIGQVEEFIEIEFPIVNPNEKEKNEEINSWMINEKEAKKTLQAIGKIKIRHKDQGIKTQPKEDNDVTKTKLELEMTKKEIEDKKIALEKAIKEEKQKEIELKKIKELKIKEEKLRKLELKKKEKEEKLKQRENLKLQKEKEKELKKQEITKKELEEKKIALEKAILKEKQKEIEFKRLQEIKEKEETNKIDHTNLKISIPDRKEINTKGEILDEDIAKLLPIIDSLFDNLPPEILEKFAESKDFKLYEKVMLKYTNKG